MQAGRATLLIQPADRLSITLGFMHQSLTQDGASTIDNPPLTETHYQPFDVSEPFSDKFNLYTLTGKFNFDSFQLVSASAYWDRQQNQTQDISEAMHNYIGGFFLTAGGVSLFLDGNGDGGRQHVFRTRRRIDYGETITPVSSAKSFWLASTAPGTVAVAGRRILQQLRRDLACVLVLSRHG